METDCRLTETGPLYKTQQGSGLTLHILHHHAQVPPGLEGAEHGDHEGVLSKRQDVSLHESLLDLVPQDQVLLVDLLHGEALSGFFMSNQINGSV